MRPLRNWRTDLVDSVGALLLAAAIDLLVGEPPEALHPVVWLGKSIDTLEKRAPDPDSRSSLAYGALTTLGIASAATVLGLACSHSLRVGPRWLRVLGLGLLLKPAFAVRALLRAGGAVHEDLQRDELVAARESLRSLVSRDTAELTSEECSSAAVESLAENVTDSFIGPWLAFLAFGLPGAWLFRAINTLDSRWGYRGRYEKLGKPAALLDDVAASVPARLSAVLLAVSARLPGFDAAGALRSLTRERTKTSSPNAGWTMATMAGALDCRLEKAGEYRLNSDARPCTTNDLPRAQRLVLASGLLFLTSGSFVAWVLRRTS